MLFSLAESRALTKSAGEVLGGERSEWRGMFEYVCGDVVG